MARPAPSDLSYAPSHALSFAENALPLSAAGGTMLDLTAQDPQYQYAANALYVMSVSAPAAGDELLVVRMQGDPTTDVILHIPPGAGLMFRGAFTAIAGSVVAGPVTTASSATLRITAFWHGGPA